MVASMEGPSLFGFTRGAADFGDQHAKTLAPHAMPKKDRYAGSGQATVNQSAAGVAAAGLTKDGPNQISYTSFVTDTTF